MVLQWQKNLSDIGGTIQDGCHLAVMRAGVHPMSDELILQISCNIYLAFKRILMMTSGQNISHYTTAKLSVHVWNHDLIWWQNKIDTQKHFRKTTITSSTTLSKTKIPITIVKAQMPSNPNQKSRTRDNKARPNWNRPILQIPECTCSISNNAPFRTEMCTFLFWTNIVGHGPGAFWDLWIGSIESGEYA